MDNLCYWVKRWFVFAAILAAIPLAALGAPDKPTEADAKEAARIHAEGLRLFNRCEYKPAIKQWLKELSIAPDSPSALNDIGIAYTKLGKPGKALHYHREALRIDPSSAHARYSLGQAYFALEKYEEARTAFRQAVKLTYKLSDSYYKLGETEQRLGNVEEALNCFQKAADLSPADGWIRYRLGQCHMALHHYEQAREEFQKQIETGLGPTEEARRAIVEVNSRLLTLHASEYTAADALPEGCPAEKEGLFRTFPFPTDQNYHRIITSPLDPSKFWLTNQNGIAREFDPATGFYSELGDPLDEFAYGLMDEKLLQPDPFDKDLAWIGNWHKGLILINTKTGERTIFKAPDYWPGSGPTCLLPEQEGIWIGSPDGLSFYDRKKKAITPEPKLNGIWINSLHREGDRLWLGNAYFFYPKDRAVRQVYEFKNWPIAKVEEFDSIGGYKAFSGNDPEWAGVLMDPQDRIIHTSKGWPLRLVLMDLDSNLWLTGRTLWRINTKSSALTTVKLPISPPSGRRTHEDSAYVYFSSSNGLLRYKKEDGSWSVFPVSTYDLKERTGELWLLSRNCLIRVSLDKLTALFQPMSILTRKEDCQAMVRSLSAFDGLSMADKIKRTAQFFRAAPTCFDRHGLEEAEYPIQEATKNGFSTDDVELLEPMLRKTTDPLEAQVICYLIATKSLLRGDIERSMKYFSILQIDYLDGPIFDMLLKSGGLKIEKAFQQYQEFKRLIIPDDERYWRLGQIYLEALKVEWNESASFYDLEFALDHFRKILELYPDGSWADDARWLLLEYGEDVHYEIGIVDLECVPAYEKFLKDYPASPHSIDAKMEIADHYLEYDPEDAPLPFDEKKRYLDKAKALYQEIIRDHPGSAQAKEARGRIADAARTLQERGLKLVISSDYSTYSVGQPILITFVLVNQASEAREIQIKPGHPNFHLSVEFNYGPAPFLFNPDCQQQAPQPTGMVIAANGGIYKEIHDILNKTLSADSDRLCGAYRMDKPGVYTLRGSFPDENILSNELNIEVRAKSD